MEFSPFNKIVKRCIQGMEMETKGNQEEAKNQFILGWQEATTDFEKFLASYYVARHQNTVEERLLWLEKSLALAKSINNDTVNSALPALYLNIAQCYEDLSDTQNAKLNFGIAESLRHAPSDKGPFYHGTKADLRAGDFLIAGGDSNYKSEFKMNHIYFTALINGAVLAAFLAKGTGPERVYIVTPTGSFENDPNVTDKKFPGNPTRSYRSEAPLKIIGEETDWEKPKSEDIERFRAKLANNNGEIIN